MSALRRTLGSLFAAAATLLSALTDRSYVFLAPFLVSCAVLCLFPVSQEGQDDDHR